MTAFRSGDVVIAAVLHPTAGRSDYKPRPAVFVTQQGRVALLAGLTTVPTYGNGVKRQSLRWRGAGPHGKRSFLWGGQLVSVPLIDVDRVVGHLGPEDWALVCELHGLKPTQYEA